MRISQSEARSLGSRRVEKVNNFYWNMERSRKFFSNPVIVLQYECLCNDAVKSLILISDFLQLGMLSSVTVWDMLYNYPEFQCRHAGRRAPRQESFRPFAYPIDRCTECVHRCGSVGKILGNLRLQPQLWQSTTGRPCPHLQARADPML